MDSDIVIWEAPTGTQVFLLKDAQLHLHGRFVGLKDEGKPELYDPEMEELRKKLEQMEPFTDQTTQHLNLNASIGSVMICGYENKVP